MKKMTSKLFMLVMVLGMFSSVPVMAQEDLELGDETATTTATELEEGLEEGLEEDGEAIYDLGDE